MTNRTHHTLLTETKFVHFRWTQFMSHQKSFTIHSNNLSCAGSITLNFQDQSNPTQIAEQTYGAPLCKHCYYAEKPKKPLRKVIKSLVLDDHLPSGTGFFITHCLTGHRRTHPLHNAPCALLRSGALLKHNSFLGPCYFRSRRKSHKINFLWYDETPSRVATTAVSYRMAKICCSRIWSHTASLSRARIVVASFNAIVYHRRSVENYTFIMSHSWIIDRGVPCGRFASKFMAHSRVTPPSQCRTIRFFPPSPNRLRFIKC